LSYAIVAPNKKETMFLHMKELKSLWVKTFFDPGQAIFSMNKQDLLESMHFSNYLILNDYEFNIFMDVSWLEKEEIIKFYDKVIITMWEKWSVILDNNNEIFISSIKNFNVVDPTWAWDAYRAWLLTWLNKWYTWEASANIWSLLASNSLWCFWAQNHFIELKKFQKLYKEEFWDDINLEKQSDKKLLLENYF
jgi:sugar/nucleoside kinase (ribokinase family)